MTSIRIRQDTVPVGAIVIQSDELKPIGYINETTLFDKYLKGTPTAGTNPGGSEGSDTHIHNSDGDHNHTTSSTTHLHTVQTGVTPNFVLGSTVNQNARVTPNHSHVYTADNTTPTVTVTSEGAFTHNAKTNESVHKTQFLLNHNESSIGLRRKTLGQDSIFMWGQITGNLPSKYSPDTNFDDQHLKGVLNAGATPNVSGGTDTHQHDAHPTHKHDLTLPAHAHVLTSDSTTVTAQNISLSGASQRANTHNHPPGTATMNNSTANPTASPTNTLTIHPSLNHEIAFKTITFVKQPHISLREHGIIPGGLVMWLDVVSNIPTGWQVADGTNGTSNYLGKYPKGIPNAGVPGTTGGSNTHTHTTGGGGHTHAATNLSHTHPSSGSTGQASATAGHEQTSAEEEANHVHQHPVTAASSSTNPNPTLISDTDTHTHNLQNNQPETILVSIIERLTT